uniref:Uncharacterized protein n=1 Tax=Pyrodinium bahamense TaxID=73915 RepID=A0A7R9ZZK1_9DINO|mmetsp:Transcript_16750/g.46073  ORF Transcript_16750/g.46073 Transcript_16750/m.46073 type:complete len:290 (+) Transcript_16750:77-946(+)
MAPSSTFARCFVGLLSVGHCATYIEDCADGQCAEASLGLLQRGFNPVRHKERIPVNSFDHHGRWCSYCGPPSSDRIDRLDAPYTLREDCGNLSTPLGIPGPLQEMPLTTFARDSDPPTNAYCELNFQKGCSDAVANRDFLYFGKVVDLRSAADRKSDGSTCLKQGFLQPSLKALAKNFSALQALGRQLCETKFAKYRWKGGITLRDGEEVYTTHRSRSASEAMAMGLEPDTPSQEEAEFLAAWKCALGNGELGCEMAFCAYTFCDKGGGETGAYEECPGWDPVRGNVDA